MTKLLDQETKQEIKAFLEEIVPSLKQEIDNNHHDYYDIFADIAYIELTISTNNDANEWHYQTGDNSYHGSCYFHPHWAVVYITEESEVDEILQYVISRLEDLLNQ